MFPDLDKDEWFSKQTPEDFYKSFGEHTGATLWCWPTTSSGELPEIQWICLGPKTCWGQFAFFMKPLPPEL